MLSVKSLELNMKIRRYILAISIFVFVFLVLLSLSYLNAKKVADALMAPTKPDFALVECNLSAHFFKDGRPIDKITGVGWKVLFDTDKYFTNPLEVYVSITGEIVATNPTDLRERIERKLNMIKNS
jgi:hypothetical protein